MGGFERSRGGPKRSRSNIDVRGRPIRGKPRGGSRGGPRGRPAGRDRPRKVNMTKVICDECGVKCEVPFNPSSDKPVLCKDCFSGSKPKGTSSQLDQINEKLNKIMKALDIK